MGVFFFFFGTHLHIPIPHRAGWHGCCLASGSDSDTHSKRARNHGNAVCDPHPSVWVCDGKLAGWLAGWWQLRGRREDPCPKLCGHVLKVTCGEEGLNYDTAEAGRYSERHTPLQTRTSGGIRFFNKNYVSRGSLQEGNWSKLKVHMLAELAEETNEICS